MSMLSNPAAPRPSLASSVLGQPKQKISGYNLTQVPRMSPETMNLYQSLLGAVQSPGLTQGLGMTGQIAGGQEDAFRQMEQPAYTAFDKLSGNIGSRFSGFGMGARNSSGFQNAMAGAAGELGENLASNRMALQRQAIQDLLGLSGTLFGNQPYEYGFAEKREKKKPLWKSITAGALPILGAIGGGMFGGPAGATLGASAGSAAGKAFL